MPLHRRAAKEQFIARENVAVWVPPREHISTRRQTDIVGLVIAVLLALEHLFRDLRDTGEADTTATAGAQAACGGW